MSYDRFAPMRDLFIPVIKRLCFLGWSACWCIMVTGTAWSGTINGTIKYAGQAIQKKKLKVTIDKYICGDYKDDESFMLSPDKGIGNAVVSLLLGPGGNGAATPQPVEVKMNQKNCVFLPHVLVVPVGGTVNFLTSDRLLHNTHSRSKINPPFNRAQPKGRTIRVKFKKPEIIRVDCDLHSWMHAWVIVANHQFYAVTDAQGEFVLRDVPPGNYTLQVWHESLGTTKKKVSVTNEGMTPVMLEMAAQ